jgi:hypothetical protein
MQFLLQCTYGTTRLVGIGRQHHVSLRLHIPMSSWLIACSGLNFT